jgi:cob(I)alamin adenosyltransferase
VNDLGRGYVQIYTGNGKGKTTAALGLAVRAAGWGLKTAMIQFMKGQFYGELEGIKRLAGLVTIEQFGHPQFCRFTDPPDKADVELAQAALARLAQILTNPSCDILIADEAITAMMYNLVTEDEILVLIAKKPPALELILTGRGITPQLIEAADLVTEMKDIKHYYSQGIQARKGIES